MATALKEWKGSKFVVCVWDERKIVHVWPQKASNTSRVSSES